MRQNIRRTAVLRKGYTTGSCCAAGACAGLWYLLTGEKRDSWTLEFRGGRITVPVKFTETAGGKERNVWTDVIKDSGDDPDVTDGILIRVSVDMESREEFENRNSMGRTSVFSDGVFSAEKAGAGEAAGEKGRYVLGGRIAVETGKGIGTVKGPGLACPEGFPAVNPGPLMMIQDNICGIMEKTCSDVCVRIGLHIPEGEKTAEKTFNSRLGIEGGISVLGTTGIVEPMSSRAMIDTCRIQLDVARASGCGFVVITPGNYGKDFLDSMRDDLMFLKDISDTAVIKCSNFIGETLKAASEKGFTEVILSGHLGKMVKFAGGMTDTHSRFGDNRMETLSEAAEYVISRMKQEKHEKCESIPDENALRNRIMKCLTVDQALDITDEAGITDPVMIRIAEMIKETVEREGLGEGFTTLGIMIYTNRRGLLYAGENIGEIYDR